MNGEQQSFGQIIWDFLCSLKLTIVTLILLAATSVIGTVIQQNRAPEEYRELYGEGVYRLFAALQFFDMYHSWWFLGLLTLFVLNLSACSLKRLPRVWRTVRAPLLTADEGHYRTLGNGGEWASNKTAAESAESLAALLSRRFARPVLTEADGKIHLYAEKAPWSRFGVYATHLSIIVIFVGAIIGNIWGFKAHVNIVEGTETSQVWQQGRREPIDLGFSVRCDEFAVTYYDGSSRPREFMSILDVVEGGETVVADRKIVVNDPLTYKGITFYQSSYGPVGEMTFKLQAQSRESGETLELTARQGEHLPLPGGYSVAVTDFAPSYDRFGPAVQMHVNTPDGRHGKPFVVLQDYPDFDAGRDAPFRFSFLGHDQRQYTGLQVKKDPGVWTVWAGCLLMVLGSLTAFLLSHQRIWVCIEPAPNSCRVRVGGSAHRNQAAFEIFFDALKGELQQAL